MRAKLHIYKREVEKLKLRAEFAADNGLREVCGIFTSSPSGKLNLRYIPNRVSEPYQYRMNYKDVRMAIGKGPYWGTFHTHPVGRAFPSIRDQEVGYFGKGMIIYSDIYGTLRYWEKFKKTQFREQAIRVLYNSY